jgi:lysozyme family protein
MSFESVYYGHTKTIEGGYANSTKDQSGGETYKGVSRLNHPKWEGWQIVDEAKESLGLTTAKTYGKSSTWSAIDYKLRHNDRLNDLVEDFYYEEFYLPYEKYVQIQQRLRDKMFDTAVNTGHYTAVKILQRAVNCFLSTDNKLIVDGLIGPKTLGALAQCETEKLLAHYAAYHRNHYEVWLKTPKGKVYWAQREAFFARAAWLPREDD